MNMRFWMSLLVTVLVIAGCLSIPFITQTTLPFDTEARFDGDRPRLLVAPSSVGLPMPAGLQSGDEIDFQSMDPQSQPVFETSVGNQPAGSAVTLVIQRGAQRSRVQVPFVVDHKSGENLAVFATYVALTWLFGALGLLLLWRGQRQAAWAVCLWCLLNVLGNVVTNFGLPMAIQAALGRIATDLLNVGALVALYLLADDLTREGISATARRVLRVAFIVAASAYSALIVFTHYIVELQGGLAVKFRWPVISVHLLGFAIPLLLLALFYRQAQPADRPRIRWVWISIVFYVASYVLNLNLINGLDGLQAGMLLNLATGAAFLGFTYAVLRHRLVSVRLVLNRALVYGVITSLVVGVFAALSSLIEHFAVGKTEGALLQLLVPLSLGVTLNLIKKRLDGFVERLFFQRQYRAETALTRLIRESAFIEDRDTLLDRTVGETLEYLRPTGVALYERSESGYTLVRQQGERKFPKSLAKDDAAMVSLRASLSEADLDSLSSTLGKEGLAFPLAVRGTLTGALVLGQRPAEHYTQSERALLARIGQQVAAALHALRAREAETFVDAVARGELAAPPKTKSRARQLLQQSLAA